MEGIREDNSKFSQSCEASSNQELVELLARAVQARQVSGGLLVGAFASHSGYQTFETVPALARYLGRAVDDICCLFPHQIGSEKWRLLTTHGHALVERQGSNFEINICYNGTPSETIIVRHLLAVRNKLLSGKKEDVPYPQIQGTVLLCCDFLTVIPITFLGLQEIFKANGAKKVIFVTPTIPVRDYQLLSSSTCDIVRLHPPDSGLSELTRGFAV